MQVCHACVGVTERGVACAVLLTVAHPFAPPRRAVRLSHPGGPGARRALFAHPLVVPLTGSAFFPRLPTAPCVWWWASGLLLQRPPTTSATPVTPVGSAAGDVETHGGVRGRLCRLVTQVSRDDHTVTGTGRRTRVWWGVVAFFSHAGNTRRCATRWGGYSFWCGAVSCGAGSGPCSHGCELNVA